jgi:hypothetical protein
MFNVVCKWCHDRQGGCLMCFAEIEKQEKERTEHIRNWQPPDEWLVELIGDFDKFTRIIQGKENLSVELGPDEDVALILLYHQMTNMGQKEREDFAAQMQMPPPVFRANQRDPEAMDVLKQFFHRQVLEKEIRNSPEGQLNTLKTGEKARIELAARKQFRR